VQVFEDFFPSVFDPSVFLDALSIEDKSEEVLANMGVRLYMDSGFDFVLLNFDLQSYLLAIDIGGHARP
jgi:hypothetical protein